MKTSSSAPPFTTIDFAAIPLFTVSLLAVLAQNTYTFLLADGLAVFGGAAAALPALVIAIGIAMLLYAMRALKRGWLK